MIDTRPKPKSRKECKKHLKQSFKEFGDIELAHAKSMKWLAKYEEHKRGLPVTTSGGAPLHKVEGKKNRIKEVLNFIAENPCSTAFEIRSALGISPHTMKEYLRALGHDKKITNRRNRKGGGDRNEYQIRKEKNLWLAA